MLDVGHVIDVPVPLSTPDFFKQILIAPLRTLSVQP